MKMRRIWLFKLNKEYLINNKGFTLTEVLVALFIIGLLIFTFSPILGYGLKNINSASEKRHDLYEDNGNLQISLAKRDISEGSSIPVVFEDDKTNTYIVNGGIVKSGDMEAFMAGAASMAITPVTVNEGYAPSSQGASTMDIKISGKETHFGTKSVLTVRDAKGNTVSGCRLSITNKENAILRIPLTLKNSGSPYEISITTPVYNGLQTGRSDETVKAELEVNLPRFICAGNSGAVMVSGDGSYWTQGTGVSDTVNDIITGIDLTSDNNRAEGKEIFIAVGQNGTILYLKDKNPWIKKTPVSANLKSVVYGNGRYIAVGDNGKIIISDDLLAWHEISSGVTSNLNKIAWNGSVYVVVGDLGTILCSQDGASWSKISASAVTRENLYSVAWLGSRFTAVGEKGIIISSSDGQIWNKVNTSFQDNLNDICANDNLNLIVAVGDKGTIVSSGNGGVTWSKLAKKPTTKDLLSIAWGNGVFAAVGKNGAIYTSENGASWTSHETSGSVVFNAVAAR